MGLNPNSPVHEPNGNTVTLREYIEAIMSERDRALTAAFNSQQAALNLATRNLELRLEKLNELRAEVTQDRSNFLTRDRYESQHQALEDKVALLEGFRGRALGFGALVSLLSAVGGALAVKAIGG
jgi:hypothetical protein